MSVEEQIERVEEKLDEWVKKAVGEVEREMFEGEQSPLSYDELRRIHQIDIELKENGRKGIWGDVEYDIEKETGLNGTETVELHTFGVPVIPADLEEISVELDEKKRKRYNNILSEYGVEVSNRVEEMFEDWKRDRQIK
ncbi:MAG: hypothetical protein SXQ77_09710 [Halobacteria archaeon]|nr:hypothetical protein [Halobacteria archaeon]